MRSVSSIHLFLASLAGPSPLLRLVLSLLESSRHPPTSRQAPRWLLVLPRPAEKEQGMGQADQAADVRDVGPGPERAQPRGFQSQILLPVVMCLSTTPGQGRWTEGQSTGGPRAQLPLSLGNITAFQCQSHFKLISLCIMFFKSFLNKTEIQSVSLSWDVGTKIGFSKSELKKLLGEQGALGCLGAAPRIHLPDQQTYIPPLQKADPGGPVLLGSQEYSPMMPHLDPR